jgi:hypothetical protein
MRAVIRERFLLERATPELVLFVQGQFGASSIPLP